MAYTKTNWVDRSVQYPQRFTRTSDGTYDTLVPAPGTVTNSGTPITAATLNNIENGIANLDTNKANKAQEAWHDLTLVEGWANSGGNTQKAQYMKDELGYVHIKGVIQNGNNGNGSWICSPLPVGYKPAESFYCSMFSAYGTNYTSNATLQFNTDGTVVVWANMQIGLLVLDIPLFQGV
jgi:hypothetical protein